MAVKSGQLVGRGVKPAGACWSKAELHFSQRDMNELLGQVIENLRRFEVQLVMRRNVRSRFPPRLMSDLAFTFNGHATLGDHSQRMVEAVQIAKAALLSERDAAGHETEALAVLRSFQLEVKLLLLEVEGRMELEIHDGIIEGTAKLCNIAEGKWDDLCREVRMFVAQQETLARQLLLLVQEIEALPAVVASRNPVDGGAAADGEAMGGRIRLEDFGWKGEETALLELFLALEETGVLRWRRFEWKRTERLKRFSAAFGIEMKHSYQNINYLMNRKSGPARFMSQCSQALEHFREVREVEQNPPR